MKQCPSCQAAISDESKECPRCGILFAKWQEREANVESGNLSRYQRLDKATSSGFNWTILILFCLVILGIFYFLSKNAALNE